ncbi:hypothetical protein [Halalkalicoccus sp. NIPERK01]|nr:hypothetical protein [Halalkalicoccus sp. NIPERK01]MDL5362406.1 hypothetical protein [Halalkalicoccus sp. NIPERK01]
MSLTGVCQHCERAPASHTCPNCGSLVCDRHFDGPAGRCARCLGGMG